MIIYYCVYLIEFNPYLVKKVNLLDSHGINFFMNTTLLLQVLSELHFLAKNQPEIIRIQQFGFLRQISQLQTILIIINFFRRTPLRLNEILQVWHYLILIPPLFPQNSAGGVLIQQSDVQFIIYLVVMLQNIRVEKLTLIQHLSQTIFV